MLVKFIIFSTSTFVFPTSSEWLFVINLGRQTFFLGTKLIEGKKKGLMLSISTTLSENCEVIEKQNVSFDKWYMYAVFLQR